MNTRDTFIDYGLSGSSILVKISLLKTPLVIDVYSSLGVMIVLNDVHNVNVMFGQHCVV